jgi:hypothetical protein
LRLALRDLAVILDTLGRLEQVRPDLKAQMLRELADADAITAAAVVSRWRARLPEFQEQTERGNSALLDFKKAAPSHGQPTAGKDTANPEPPPVAQSNNSIHQPDDRAATCDVQAESDISPRETDSVVLLDAIGDAEPPILPSWDDLLDSLVGLTRERADELGPDAIRAKMQLALLELVRRSQDERTNSSPDPQLWTHLDPAIQYCFGNSPSNQSPPPDVVRSLQVATELLRGPGRLQVRGLAFCTRIRGFGNIDRAEANALKPGQPVLLYGEVEHFLSDPVAGGFRTRIGSVIELLDSGGRVIWSQDFGAVEDISSGPRRDYFLSYRFHIPQNIKPGVCSIRLTLRDDLANRSACGAIAFSIR